MSDIEKLSKMIETLLAWGGDKIPAMVQAEARALITPPGSKEGVIVSPEPPPFMPGWMVRSEKFFPGEIGIIKGFASGEMWHVMVGDQRRVVRTEWLEKVEEANPTPAPPPVEGGESKQPPRRIIVLAEGMSLFKAGETGSWEDAQQKRAAQEAGESTNDRAAQRKEESNARIKNRVKERMAAHA
jgi:hypothetical protein